MNLLSRFAVVATTVFLSACATPIDIKRLGDGLYQVTKEDQTATEGKMSDLRAAAFKSATTFAARQGKRAVSVQEREVPVNRPHRSAYFEYTFRLEP